MIFSVIVPRSCSGTVPVVDDRTKARWRLKIGQRKGFSDTDIRKINTLCKFSSGSCTTARPTTTPGPKPSGCEDSDARCDGELLLSLLELSLVTAEYMIKKLLLRINGNPYDILSFYVHDFIPLI